MPRENVDIVISAKDQASSILNGIKGQIVSIGAAFGAWRIGKQILSDIYESSKQNEQSNLRLAASVDRQGLSWSKSKDQLTAFSDGMQRITGVADELVKGSLQKFIDFGATIPEAMRAVKVAADFAAGAEMDLSSATMILARAKGGSTQLLSRYGITVDQTKTKAEQFTQVLELLERRFGGQAQAQMAGMEGAVKSLGFAWEDLIKTTSDTVVWKAVETAIRNVALVMSYIPEIVKASWDALKSFVDAIAISFTEAANIVSSFGTILRDVLHGDFMYLAGDADAFKKQVATSLLNVSGSYAAFSQSVGNELSTYATILAQSVLNAQIAGQAIVKANKVVSGISQQQAKEFFDAIHMGAAEARQNIGVVFDPEDILNKESLQVAKEAGQQLQDKLLEGVGENIQSRGRATFARFGVIFADASAKAQQMASIFSGPLNGAISGLIHGTVTVGQAAKEMVLSIISNIVQMVIETAIVKALTQQYLHLAAAKEMASSGGGGGMGGGLPGGGGLGSLFQLLTLPFFFDDPKNDAQAYRSGGDFFRNFYRGGMDYLQANAHGEAQRSDYQPGIEVHLHGEGLTGIIKKVEMKAAKRTSQISLRQPAQTFKNLTYGVS